MDAFVVFLVLALVVVGVPVLLLVLVLWRDLGRVQKRYRDLENRLTRLEGTAPASAPGASVPAGASAPVSEAAATPAPVPPQPSSKTTAPPRRLDLEAIVGGQWLTWLGVLAIFFGTAFFLAIDLRAHVMSGAGQVLTGVLVGGLFLFAGSRLVRRAQRFLGEGLLGGGIALLFLAAYASFGFHHLIPAAVLYPLLLVAALVGAWVALSLNSLMAASLSLAGALVTPLLLATGDDHTRVFFPYLVAVSLGTVVVAFRRRWSVLPLAGFLGTVVLVLSWWDDTYTPDHRVPAILGIGCLWLLYALLPVFSREDRRPWSVARALVGLGNGLAFSAFLCAWLVPEWETWRGPALFALALLYVVGAKATEGRRGAAPGIRMLHYTGIVVAAVAIPVQFDLAGITLGWTLLGTALFWGGIQFRDGPHRALAYAVYALAAFRVLTFDTITTVDRPAETTPFWNIEFVAAMALAAALLWSALRLRGRKGLYPPERRLDVLFVLAAAALPWWRVSADVFAAFERGAGGSDDLGLLLTLSLVWAVYAGMLILLGFWTHYRPVRVLGVGILALLILKVFLLDMQELERGYRIASFVGVGILLLAISVLYQRERKT